MFALELGTNAEAKEMRGRAVVALPSLHRINTHADTQCSRATPAHIRVKFSIPLVLLTVSQMLTASWKDCRLSTANTRIKAFPDLSISRFNNIARMPTANSPNAQLSHRREDMSARRVHDLHGVDVTVWRGEVRLGVGGGDLPGVLTVWR